MTKEKELAPKIIESTEKPTARPERPVAIEKPSVIFTYKGIGAESPQIIKFMDAITFSRGKATKVQIQGNEKYIAKLKMNPSFVEGEVEPDDILAEDEQEKKIVAAKKKEDKALNEEVKRKHRTA